MKRIVAWLIVVVTLSGLGRLIHFHSPASPRWVARIATPHEGTSVAIHLRGDRVTTMPTRSGYGDGPLEVRDAVTGRVVVRSWEDEAVAWSVEFSPDGKLAAGIVSDGSGQAVREVDLTTGQLQHYPLDKGTWKRAFYLKDSSFLFVDEADPIWESGSLFDMFRTWRTIGLDRRTKKTIGTMDRSVFGTLDGSLSSFLVISGNRLLTIQFFHSVQVWSPTENRRFEVLDNCFRFMESHDGRRLWVKTGKACELWDIDAKPRRLASLPVPVTSPRIMTFSPCGRWAFLMPKDEGDETIVTCLDSATGQVKWASTLGKINSEEIPLLSPDDRWAALVEDRSVHPVDQREKRLLLALKDTDLTLFAPDPSTLLVTRADGTLLRFIDTSLKEEQAPALPVFRQLTSWAFHVNGRQLWGCHPGRELPPDTWWTNWLVWLRLSAPVKDVGQLVALEWPSQRELFRFVSRGAHRYAVAEDGSYVVTVQNEGLFQKLSCWDVPQRRPWAWSLGVPLALGVGIVVLVRLWSIRTPKKEATTISVP